MTGIGIIGAGFIGAVHARAIAQVPGLRLAAVCRPDADGLAAFAAVHGGTPYRDYRALLDDPAVQAVLVAAPHHLHEPLALDVLRAGRPLMIEKPMAPTAAACARIVAAAEAAGVALMPGHTMRFTRACRAARETMARPAVGPLRYARSAFIKTWMEENRRDWHLRADGGGMLLTAGIHALDRVIYLANRRVAQVAAVVDTAFHDQEADDAALLLLRFEGGGAAQICGVGYRDGAPTNDALLVCDGATLRLDFEAGVTLGRGGAWTALPGSTEADWAARAIRRQWEEFAAVLRGEMPPPVTGAEAGHVIAVIEAAFAAARERREVAVAP